LFFARLCVIFVEVTFLAESGALVGYFYLVCTISIIQL
jgi:hypothetical protein